MCPIDTLEVSRRHSSKLRAADALVAAALKVQVVSQQLSAADHDLTHECYPSPNSFLEGLNVRKEPPRLPEVRLASEAQYS